MSIRSQALHSLAGILLLFLAGASARGQSAPAPALQQLQGSKVVAVRIVGENNLLLQENPAPLPLQPGQLFSIDTERDSLRQLFRTGLYADVVAEAVPVAGGFRVDFVVRRNFYVNSVQVDGLHEPPSDAVAVSSLRLTFGDIFRESDMPAALDRMQQTLQDEGLYQAKLTYDLSPNDETRQMNITVHVSPGPRAAIASLSLTNDTPFPDAALRGRLKIKRGAQITSQRLENSAERVRNWLVSRNYLGARVSLDRGAYDPRSNTVPLQVHLTSGFALQIRVEGWKFSAGTLRKLLPIYQEGAVDEDLLQEGRRNLRDALQREGYFDADVSYNASQPNEENTGSTSPAAKSPGPEVITYSVERGARHRLEGYSIDGNRYFSGDLLRSRLQIQTAAFASRGRFSSALVDADVASIAALYQANGFLQAQVADEVIDNYHGHREALYVRFHVTEGLQTRVSQLQIEGNRAFSSEMLSAVIGSTPGQPFSDFNVAGDRDNILALYYNRGFPQASFKATVENIAGAAGKNPEVDLTYHIVEGPQFLVSHVFVGGLDHTRPNVAEREIQLKQGQPLSESDVVESQRRLYDLGIFSRVSIAPQNPDGTETAKNVGVLLEEARRYTIGYGVGLEALQVASANSGPASAPYRVSPRGTLEFTKLNFTGRADTFSIKVRASTLQGRAQATYTASNYFGHPNFSLQLSGYYEKARDIATFTSTRTEGSVQFTDHLSTSTSILFRYAYRHVLATDLQISPEEIPLYNQPTRVSLVGATWLRDRRDSPSDASHGSLNTVDADVAMRAIGSSASYLRVFLQNSTYTPIGRRLVFARSVRVGTQTPIGNTLTTDIPLPERFFAGGATTLRGFGLNQAGPRDPLTGFPIGGLGMLIFNQQLQFPMHLPYLGNHVGGAIFYDAGNVFTTFRQITLRYTPPTPVFSPTQADACLYNCTNQMNYFSHTVGFEFRYHTPIGPVSIDLAYQLNAPQFLEPDGVTLPNGTPGLTLARLGAFQFSVNLGATF